MFWVVLLPSVFVMGLLIYACFNMVNLPVRGLEEVQIKLLDAPSSIKDIRMKSIDVFTDSIKVKDRASFKKAINEKLTVIDGDSLNETVKEIRAHISLIERQQEHFIADIRQEVNNCIEKYNGWLAFWISILAVLCGIIPVLLQYRLYKDGEEKIKAKMSKMEQDILNSKCALLANSALVIMENQYIQDSDNRLSVINEIYQRAVGAFEELLQKIYSKEDKHLTKEEESLVVMTLTQLLTILEQMARSMQNGRIRNLNKSRDEINKRIDKILSHSEPDMVVYKNLIHLPNQLQLYRVS